jgi:ubiquinone/menaquinone biosynthesis C-methylase UbiE
MAPRLLVFAGILAVPFLHAQQPTDAELNKAFAQMDKALGVRPGATIADIGTGPAVQHPIRIAGKVAPDGNVVCVDISQSTITKIQRQIEDQHITNLQAVLGKDDDPMLLPGAFDAILVSNTYHEFTQPSIMLKRICEALKPSGTLVVVENYSITHRTESRAEQAKRHDMAPETLEAELSAAGFVVKERIDPILANSADRLRYLVRAERQPR